MIEDRSPGAGSTARPASKPAGLLTLRGAGVRFGTLVALQGVDLTVCEGERIVFVGANGSGKSTLLRVLHGLLPLDEGERVVDGHLAGEPRMAMVFQRPFMLRMSVQANLELALRLARVPRERWASRVEESLRHVGLQGMQRRNARALSLGQQQRLAFARAWALAPQVLLLDEPTASLDPAAKQEIEAMIAAFVEQGVTLLMSSHNLGQVKRVASRVLYLEAGRVRVDKPCEEFFASAHDGPAALFMRGEWPGHLPG
jgi:tungstate transport system ATP-binding protein